MKRRRTILLLFLLIACSISSAWAVEVQKSITIGGTFHVDPYIDSGLSRQCRISYSATCSSSNPSALVVSVASITPTECKAWDGYTTLTGNKIIFAVTANQLGVYTLNAEAKGWLVSDYQAWVATENVTYTVTVKDNGGGLTKDYDVCYYTDGIHYHCTRNSDGSNTVTLNYIINGAYPGHAHGYPAIDESKIATSVSIPAKFTSGSVEYTVTRIEKLFARNAQDGNYNDGLNSIKTLTIPSSVKSVDEDAFVMGMGSLKTVVWNASRCELSGPVFPSSVSQINIGSSARWLSHYFTARTSVTSLVVPSGITYIGKHAFAGTKLSSITLNASEVQINPQAFAHYNGYLSGTDKYKCLDNTALKTLSWNCPQYTCGDNENPLAYAAAVTTLNIGSAMTAIPDSLFNRLPINSLVIPEGVTSIENGAFSECPNLRAVTVNAARCENAGPYLPASVTTISFGSSVRWVSHYLTAGTSVTSLIVPSGVTYIGKHAFAGAKLSSITLDAASVQINPQAFAHYNGYLRGTEQYQCLDNTALKTLTWNCPQYTCGDNENPLCYATGVTSLTIGSAIKTIPANLFIDLRINNLTISEGVTLIEANAFEGCVGVLAISIPSTVREIGSMAFHIPDSIPIWDDFYGQNIVEWRHAAGLQSITCHIEHPAEVTYGTDSEGNRDQFICHNSRDYEYYHEDKYKYSNGIDVTTCRLLVPKGSVEEYRSTKPWSDFVHIEEIDDHHHYNTDVNGDHRTDVDDLNIVINIMLKRPTPFADSADVTGDNHVDIDDVNAIINSMLGKG